MKTFYLNRLEDLHGHSGLGTVAEGVIFNNGMVAMTWISPWPTVTTFPNVKTVERLHGHDGRTVLVIEGRRKDLKQFEICKAEARAKKTLAKRKDPQND